MYRISSNPKFLVQFHSRTRVPESHWTLARTNHCVSLHSEVRRARRDFSTGKNSTLIHVHRDSEGKLETRYKLINFNTSPLDYAKLRAVINKNTSAAAAAAARCSASTWKRATAVNVHPSRRSGELKLARHRTTPSKRSGESPPLSLSRSPPSRRRALNDSHDMLSLSLYTPFLRCSPRRSSLQSVTLCAPFPTCRPPDALFHGRRRSFLSLSPWTISYIGPHNQLDPFSNCSPARTRYRVMPRHRFPFPPLLLPLLFPLSVMQTTRVMDRCAWCTQVRISRASSLVSLYTRTDRRAVTMLSRNQRSRPAIIEKKLPTRTSEI